MDGTRRRVAVGRANRAGRSVDHMWLTEVWRCSSAITEPYFRGFFGYSLLLNMFQEPQMLGMMPDDVRKKLLILSNVGSFAPDSDFAQISGN
jgi:hypothetical protein